MENEMNTKSSNVGGIIGAIIIIILLIAAGWYFIGNKIQKPATQNEIVTGTSTEIADIQADLDNVDLKTLDQQ